MGVVDLLFGDAIKRRVTQQVNQYTNQQTAATTANLFNQNIFKFLFDGQLIIDPNRQDYVTGGYEAVGAVYECVDMLVKKIIACPRIVYRVKSQKEYKKYLAAQETGDLKQILITKAKALEEVDMPAIENLLENPNPNMDGDTMMELLAGLYLLTGNSYLYGNAGFEDNIKSGKWSELWPLPGPARIISGGYMEPVKEYVMQQYVQNIPFPGNQVQHFKTANYNYTSTGSQLYGLSPLRPYLYSMDTLKNADKQADKQMKNGGNFGIFTPENKEDSLSQPQLDQMQESLTEAYQSNNELARMIPLSLPIKWQQIGLNSGDLELLQISDAKADDVYRGYHIPLQFRNQDSATYNNLPVANRQLVYNGVAPITRRFGKLLTKFICTPYNTSHATYIIELDFTGLPELQDDLVTVTSWLDKAWYLTPNEKREVLRWGRSAEKGMDEMWVNVNQVRVADIIAGNVRQGTAEPLTPAQQAATAAEQEAKPPAQSTGGK